MRPAPLIASGLLLFGCHSGEHPAPASSSTAKAPSSTSASAVPEAPQEPPSAPEAVTFAASDKVPLAGTLYLAKDKAAPVLVLVHRFRGDRAEWAPFATKEAAAEPRYTIINFDLRGHGQSRSASGKKRIDWADMLDKDIPALSEDVLAAFEYAISRTDGKATRGVFVGSSLGAALAARAASEDARVVAIGLVSPGAAIQGYDVYHPFADVRTLPSFLAGARDDNVAKEPLDALSRMAKDHAVVKIYDGKGHGTFGLSQQQAGEALYKDLGDWLGTVFGALPIERTVVPRGGEPKDHKG